MFALEQLNFLLDALDIADEPLGVFYSATQPDGNGPAKGLERHDCIMKYARIARKTGHAGWISRESPACRGGSVYAGFAKPNDAIARFVTTGNDSFSGERYLPNPEAMWEFFRASEIEDAPADFCVLKPLSAFKGREEPLAVIFFVRGEQLGGLCQLAFYSFGRHDAVVFPFGSGCANILSWPLLYARKGENKAVVGGSDPSCRPYLETDELSFAVPARAFQLMLEKAPESFLATSTWKKVRKKIAKSKKQWAVKTHGSVGS